MNNQLNNDQGGKQPDNKDPKNQGSNKNHQSILAFLICLLVTLVCFALFTNMLKDNSSEISYDKFIDMVDKDQVKEVTIQSSTLTIVPKKQNSGYEDMSYYTTKTEDSTALTKRLEGKGIKFKTDPPDVFGEFVAMILSVVLPTLLLFGLLSFLKGIGTLLLDYPLHKIDLMSVHSCGTANSHCIIHNDKRQQEHDRKFGGANAAFS